MVWTLPPSHLPMLAVYVVLNVLKRSAIEFELNLQVTESVLSSLRFINFDPATSDATVGASTYTVPNNCALRSDFTDGESTLA